MEVKLVNIGKGNLGNIPIDAPLISISDRYSYPPAIPNEKARPLLMLSFFPGDHLDSQEKDGAMTPEQAGKAIAFVKEHSDKGTIYVQCGEGRIRSWTICRVLGRQLEDVEHDTSRATIKEGITDRWTHNVLRTELDKGRLS